MPHDISNTKHFGLDVCTHCGELQYIHAQNAKGDKFCSQSCVEAWARKNGHDFKFFRPDNSKN